MSENPYENSEAAPAATGKHKAAAFGCTSVWAVVTFAVAALVAIAVVMLLPMFARSRVIGQQYQCKQNLDRLMTAMHAYNDDHGHFPPAFTTDEDGRRLHSWRTLLLPYLDQKSLYQSIDLRKPWDDPANALARGVTLKVFVCPAAELEPGLTTYKGLVGPTAFFPDDGSTRTTDNMVTSKTLAIVEVSPERAVHWMDPAHEDGVDFLLKRYKASDTSHFAVPGVCADGSSINISRSADEEDLKSLLDIGNSVEETDD